MNKLLTRKETADILGISMVTLEKLMKNEEAPRHVSIGRQIKFSEAEIEAWIIRNMKENENE